MRVRVIVIVIVIRHREWQLDVLVAYGACPKDRIDRGTAFLVRIVSMLYKMPKARESFAGETENQYGNGEYEYDDEYDDAHAHAYGDE